MSLSDPLMVALVNKLPKIGTVWPVEERLLWLSAAESVLNLIYGPVEKIDIGHFLADKNHVAAAAEISAVVIEKALQESHTEVPKKKGRPDDHPPRPAGIPTTFAMVREVLLDKPGMKAKEAVEAIAVKWWPGLQFAFLAPDISTAITQGRLARDADGSLTVTAKGQNSNSIDHRNMSHGAQPPATSIETKVAVAKDIAEKIMEKESIPSPARAYAPPMQMHAPPLPVRPVGVPRHVVTPGAKLGAPANPANGHAFEWNGQTIVLHEKEQKLLQRLKPTIGKGFLGFSDIANAAFSPRNCPGSAQDWLRDMVPIINPKIARLGLELKLIEKMGYSLREIG